MGPFGQFGVERRTFTKGEIQTFISAMNYRANLLLNPNIVSNHLPYSTKMSSYPSSYWELHLMYPELVAADFPPITNTGVSHTFPLTSDIIDADPGDIISIDPNSLINIRGAGQGGNNHLCLALGSNNQSIIYTPRPDFYGRVQFGFNVTDGKEKGGFVVYTFDVLRGTTTTRGIIWC
jgi:hypothetical protein